MALKLNERYPGRFTNPSADYPQGSFKNRSTPTAKDGSYLEKDWANDKEGFFQSLLSSAVVQANGSVDKVGSSQYFSALLSVIGNAGISWANISGKPTTAAGYGITDIYTKTQADTLLLNKANKATSLAGYGITDGVSKTSGWQSSAPVITGRLDALSGSQLASAISGNTVDFPPQNANSVVSHMRFANSDFSADIAVGIASIGGQLLFRGNGPTAGLGVWYETYHTGNFTPSSKISGNNCPAAGFAAGDKNSPYMMHADGTVVTLATASAAFGIGQSWQDVKAARAANTNYTNTTARTIQVNISSGDASARSLIVNGVVVAYTFATYGGNYFVTAMIPPGGTYSYTGSFSNWSEFR